MKISKGVVGAVVCCLSLCALVSMTRLHSTRRRVPAAAAAAGEAVGLDEEQLRRAAYLVPLTTPVRLISDDFRAPCFIHRTSKRANALGTLSDVDEYKFVGSWQLHAPLSCQTLLWSDDAGTALVRATEPELLPEYQWLKTGTERGDVARLVALYHFGGVYADLDMEALRPLEEWTFGHTGVGLIVGMEYCRNNTRNHKMDYGVVQFVFAATPKHPVVRRALDMIRDNVHRERTTGDVYYRNYGYNAQVMRRTGPVVLSNAVREVLDAAGLSWRDPCRAKKPLMVPGSDVLILPIVSFKPPKARKNKPLPEYAVARHHYHSTWADKSPDAWRVPD